MQNYEITYNVLTFLKFRTIITIITVQVIITYQQNKTSTDETLPEEKWKNKWHDLQSDIISPSNLQKNNNLDRWQLRTALNQHQKWH